MEWGGEELEWLEGWLLFTSCMSFAFMDTEHALAQVQTYVHISVGDAPPRACVCVEGPSSVEIAIWLIC